MAKKRTRVVCLMVFSLLAFVLFAVPVLAGSQDLSMKLKSGQYVQNANNFYIIFDKSSSMGNPYAFLEKFITEKNLVSNFNRTIPDLSLSAALRTFGQNYSDFDVTKLAYGIAKYDPADS